ncbi:MAG: ABC transporter substrate-binding protein [Firmicutes bacterium]|nr:ABC transporter substrate-binding protein [Bacillota bacterium]
MQKRFVVPVVMLLLVAALAVGCSQEELPVYKFGYGFSSHEGAFMMAAKAGKAISDKAYLEEIADRQLYRLHVDGKPVADFELVTVTGGNQAMQLMSQGHIDFATGSSAALMAAVDKGATMKGLCPIHTGGIAVVALEEFPADNWEEFQAVVKQSSEPVKVGYHSPTSAPIILFEKAVQMAGLTTTGDPNNKDADILLVDLKDTKNLVPAMNSKQVDVWVGPSPNPEIAVTTGVGKVVLDMKDMPPKGQWDDFPCCVLSTSAEMIAEHPDIVEAVVQVMTDAAAYTMENMDKLVDVMVDWAGVPKEAAEINTVKYTTENNEKFINGEAIIFEALQATDKVNEDFRDVKFEDAIDQLFNFSFIDKVLGK